MGSRTERRAAWVGLGLLAVCFLGLALPTTGSCFAGAAVLYVSTAMLAIIVLMRRADKAPLRHAVTALIAGATAILAVSLVLSILRAQWYGAAVFALFTGIFTNAFRERMADTGKR